MISWRVVSLKNLKKFNVEKSFFISGPDLIENLDLYQLYFEDDLAAIAKEATKSKIKASRKRSDSESSSSITSSSGSSSSTSSYALSRV